MEKIKKLIEDVNKPYLDLPVRTIISLLAAHYILSHTTKYGFFEVILVNGYTVSLLGSFSIALAIVYYIFKVTVFLDKKMPYAAHWQKRCAYQLLFGVLGASMLGAGLAFALFWIIGEPEKIWRYFNQDFTIILAFIIGVNAYYFILHTLRVSQRLIQHILLLVKRARKHEVMQQLTPTHHPPNMPVKRVAIICIQSHRRYLAIYTDGTQSPWSTTLEQTIEELPANEYFMINRQCIVCIDTIRCVKDFSSRRYKIVLKAPLDNQISEKLLVVSQPNIASFVRWIGDRNIWV